MALRDSKILSSDELGKLHKGHSQLLANDFNTYQEVRAFMDSYCQMLKDKINTLIDKLQNTTDTELANTLVGTINALSATLEQITDKGYVTTKELTATTDFNTIITNGKYKLPFGVHPNAPYSLNSSYTVEITVFANSWLTQKATVYGDTSNHGTYSRECLGGTWQPWQLVATTDKIDISSCLKNGWKVNGSPYAVKVGNIVSLNIPIRDGTVTANTVVLTLPTNLLPSFTSVILCNNTDSNNIVTKTSLMLVNTNGDITLTTPINSGNVLINAQYVI